MEQLILFCPVCCSTCDVEAEQGQLLEVECGACDQGFQLEIDLGRVRSSSSA